VEKITKDMNTRGEWGQFFPPFCSPHALNNSMTNEYFEIDESLARRFGFEWMDKTEEKKYDPQKVYRGSLQTSDVHFEDIQGKVFLCTQSGLPYNIQKREFEILQQKKLPLPDKHWKIRLHERDTRFIFPWRLQKRKTQDTGRVVDSVVSEMYQIREKENG